jgi:type I restriction enzyme, S subunit
VSLQRYPKYKDSGVEWLGQIPEHWNVKRLKNVCQALPSNVDKKALESEERVLLCNYTDVYYNDVIRDGLAFMPATASPEQISKFTLRAGDTVITKDSESADDIAVSAFVPADLPGVVCGYHLAVIRPQEGTCGAFIKRFFDSTFAKSCFAVRANGLTRFGLGQHELDTVDIPHPPFEEQADVAAFLDRETTKIDALVAEQRRLIELLKEKHRAVISHAVTKGLNADAPMKPSGIDWIGDVPADWTITRLKYAARMTADCPHETPHYSSDGEYAVIRTADVDCGSLDDTHAYRVNRDQYLDRIRRSSLDAQDIVYTREGERWGLAALVPTSGLY